MYQEEISNFIMETRGWIERSCLELGFGKDIISFLEFLDSKDVLDLGSGGGGLSIDYELIKQRFPKYKGKINSLNPRLANPNIDKDSDKISFSNFGAISGQQSSLKDFPRHQEISDAFKEYRKTAVAGSWTRLPYTDNSFDLILATGSYFYYRETFDLNSLEEILRILQPGGEFRASTFFGDTESKERLYRIIDIIKNSELSKIIQTIEIIETYKEESRGEEITFCYFKIQKKDESYSNTTSS